MKLYVIASMIIASMFAILINILNTQQPTAMNLLGSSAVCVVIGLLSWYCTYRYYTDDKKEIVSSAKPIKNDIELLHVLNNINHAVLITDAQQRVVAVNQSAANFFDFELENSNGLKLPKLINDTQLCDAFENYIHHQTEDFMYPQVMHEDGVIPGFNQVKFSKIQDTTSELFMIVLSGSHHDEFAAKIRERFLDRASHEFRTPLAAIQAYIEMLLDGEADDEKTRQAFYNIIQSETIRLTRLVEKVLKISSIEAGDVKTNMQVIHLDSIVDTVILDVESKREIKGVKLLRIINISRDESMVFGDKKLLSEAIDNVISNAIKFTPRNNEIQIECTVDVLRGVVGLEVRDDGVGISEKELPYIFEKFYRGETNEWYAKGAGLGLSLTRHIIKDVHGGTIKASSEISKGSVFRIELPLRSNCVVDRSRSNTQVEGSVL